MWKIYMNRENVKKYMHTAEVKKSFQHYSKKKFYKKESTRLLGSNFSFSNWSYLGYFSLFVVDYLTLNHFLYSGLYEG